MYKIGIIGHRIEDWGGKTEEIQKKITEVLSLLKFQYKDELVINLSVEPGVDLWAASTCLQSGINYHLFMPTSLDKMEIKLFDWQKENVQTVFRNARAVYIHSSDYLREDLLCDINSYKIIIEESNFCISFWSGRQNGRTYQALDYAVSNNKMMLNGLGDLSLMTKRDFEKF